jgi:hypothetical protein
MRKISLNHRSYDFSDARYELYRNPYNVKKKTLDMGKDIGDHKFT